jgi:hypothetical protein
MKLMINLDKLNIWALFKQKNERDVNVWKD